MMMIVMITLMMMMILFMMVIMIKLMMMVIVMVMMTMKTLLRMMIVIIIAFVIITLMITMIVNHRDVNQRLRDDRDSIEAAHKAVSRTAVLRYNGRRMVVQSYTILSFFVEKLLLRITFCLSRNT